MKKKWNYIIHPISHNCQSITLLSSTLFFLEHTWFLNICSKKNGTNKTYSINGLMLFIILEKTCICWHFRKIITLTNMIFTEISQNIFLLQVWKVKLFLWDGHFFSYWHADGHSVLTLAFTYFITHKHIYLRRWAFEILPNCNEN